MTAKTHYAIYALLSAIILLLLFLVISERSARNTDISSLGGQFAEATTLSDDDATEMAKNFALTGCIVSNVASEQDLYIRARYYGKWYVSERYSGYVIVSNFYRWDGVSERVRKYRVDLKTKQVNNYLLQDC